MIPFDNLTFPNSRNYLSSVNKKRKEQGREDKRAKLKKELIGSLGDIKCVTSLSV